MDQSKPTLAIRGYLLHITHYDPRWNDNKEHETPFDLNLGLKLIDEMKKANLNLLLLDPKDGVRYQSHPELARHYSQDISIIKTLADRAAEHGIEMAYKLNFSQSTMYCHNHWIPCTPDREAELLEQIRSCGPVCARSIT